MGKEKLVHKPKLNDESTKSNSKYILLKKAFL